MSRRGRIPEPKGATVNGRPNPPALPRHEKTRRVQITAPDTTRQGTANFALLGGLTGLPTPPGISPPVRTKRKTITRNMT